MKNNQPYAVVIGGLLLLALAMGISRFSYTPMLPFMKGGTNLSTAALGYLASSNYVGYLIGALSAGRIRKIKEKILLHSVIWNIISITAMGATDLFIGWLSMRLLAGITSGLIFVLASSITLDYLAQNRSELSGYLYSGVGVGIVLSGISVPVLNHLFSWKMAWIGLSFISLLLAIIVFILWKNVEWSSNLSHAAAKNSTTKSHPFLPWLIAIYGLEGFGYIITATFLVDIAYEIPKWQFYAPYFWIIVGIVAIPSTRLWELVVTKWKPIPTLCAAFLLQAIGIMLPVFNHHLFSGIISAILFGVTFMGITTICTSYARQLSPSNSHMIIGKLTAVYALGQIIGPIIAGNLATQAGHYNSALLLAGGMLSFAILLLLISQNKNKKGRISCHM